MSKRFDELFGEITAILRRDWAGASLAGDRLDPRYYNTAVGQAWHDGKLDELLFLRYVSQMLAGTGDRHLRLTMRPSDGYTPWSPGFFTRRYGDSLYVTAVTAEDRLAPGDRITAINGASPARHRAVIQKNFFYADEPEREDWRGFLKMADYLDVEHPDGSAERLALRRYPLVSERQPGEHGPTINDRRDSPILDLRNLPDLADETVDVLLPRLCKTDTPRRALTGGDVFVNYTRTNCLIKAAALEGVDGAEDYLAELRDKAGRGFLPEPDEDDAVIPGAASGPVVVLVDTWTRNGAETLALAARRAGAVLLGRPTLGTLDLCGDVSCELDERYTLTWPTAVSREAREGRPLGPVTPDVYIPWTPAECARDVLMDAAEQYLASNNSK